MHLLLVEDDPKLGRLLTRMLQEERHLVELTESGALMREGCRTANASGVAGCSGVDSI